MNEEISEHFTSGGRKYLRDFSIPSRASAILTSGCNSLISIIYCPNKVLLAVVGGELNPSAPVKLVPAASAPAAPFAFILAPVATEFALAEVAGIAAGGGAGTDGMLGVEKRGMTHTPVLILVLNYNTLLIIY